MKKKSYSAREVRNKLHLGFLDTIEKWRDSVDLPESAKQMILEGGLAKLITTYFVDTTLDEKLEEKWGAYEEFMRESVIFLSEQKKRIPNEKLA